VLKHDAGDHRVEAGADREVVSTPAASVLEDPHQVFVGKRFEDEPETIKIGRGLDLFPREDLSL